MLKRLLKDLYTRVPAEARNGVSNAPRASDQVLDAGGRFGDIALAIAAAAGARTGPSNS